MKNKFLENIVEWIKTGILAIFLSFIVTYFVLPTVVSGESMYPTLNTNDYLIVNRLAYKINKPHRGDIVVFKTDISDDKGKKKILVKRIIGLPNDHLVIKNGKVYINNNLIEEPYLEDGYTSGNTDIKIPNNSYFTMGDNRLISKDSRDSEVGVINKKKILGEVSIRLFPFNELGFVG